MTLPSAPPRTSARPAASSVRAPRGRRTSQAVIATLTPRARAMNSQRCQPEAPARKLKAAPTLCSRVMSRIGSTLVNSNTPKCRMMYALVS